VDLVTLKIKQIFVCEEKGTTNVSSVRE